MAVLTQTVTKQIWRTLYAEGISKTSWVGATLPNLTRLHDAFQALENRLEASRAVLKSDIDGALGVTTTAAQARGIMAAFMFWKALSIRQGN